MKYTAIVQIYLETKEDTDALCNWMYEKGLQGFNRLCGGVAVTPDIWKEVKAWMDAQEAEPQP